MGWFITFLPLLYPLGAVTFWLSYRSGSMKRDLLLGLAWPLTVPVVATLSMGNRIRAALKKREALRTLRCTSGAPSHYRKFRAHVTREILITIQNPMVASFARNGFDVRTEI